MLKPHVDLLNDPSHWRGQIGTNFDSRQWSQWFASYAPFILQYAALAEKFRHLGVSMFSVSCELIEASEQESYWREIISRVRGVYHGILTDAANHDGEETAKLWWDAVDMIGVDAYYYLLPDEQLPSVDDIIAAWQQAPLTTLQQLHKTWNKTIIFTEVGYCSPDKPGYLTCPSPSSTQGQQRQANFYQAVLQLFSKQDWWGGVFFWNWTTDPFQGGVNDYCFTPFNKPAEQVVRKFFGGRVSEMRQRPPSQAPLCPCIY